jgi:coproporphyrinogen III oxidase-like Fe-S oxidoreductase
MDALTRFFLPVPEDIDLAEIRRQWCALAPAYDPEQWQLPLPLWARRPYEHDGSGAWQAARRAAASSPPERPICVYLHVPFCSSKCGFCDSYSFRLGTHTDEHVERYLERLCYELRLWSLEASLSQRPVSTIHLGGGTPAFLGESALERLVRCCRQHFAVSDQTEWALETTIASLTPSMSACLDRLGFRRLHLGVQSLQPDVREAIGRRRPPGDVLRAVETHLALGWVVSVDLICGLPGQTLEGWLSGVRALIYAGVDGFSLYELLIYPQNRAWAQQYDLLERSHLANYFLYQAGASLLARQGYRKNLFNHWARDRDQNVYFTYPTRGEDLLAIGTIADGVFGDYHYRHPRYAAYLRSACAGLPGLEGGLRENPHEKWAKPLETAILSGFVPAPLVRDLRQLVLPTGRAVLERWIEHALVTSNEDGGLSLTTNGSWLAGNMVSELSCSLG